MKKTTDFLICDMQMNKSVKKYAIFEANFKNQLFAFNF